MAISWLSSCFRVCVRNSDDDKKIHAAELEPGTSGTRYRAHSVEDRPVYLLSDVLGRCFEEAAPTVFIVSSSDRPQRQRLSLASHVHIYANAAAYKALFKVTDKQHACPQSSAQLLKLLQDCEPRLIDELLAHLSRSARSVGSTKKSEPTFSILLDAASYSSRSYGARGGVLRRWTLATAQPCWLQVPRSIATKLPDSCHHSDPPQPHPPPPSPNWMLRQPVGLHQPSQPSAIPTPLPTGNPQRRQAASDPADEVLLTALAVRFVMSAATEAGAEAAVPSIIAAAGAGATPMQPPAQGGVSAAPNPLMGLLSGYNLHPSACALPDGLGSVEDRVDDGRNLGHVGSGFSATQLPSGLPHLAELLCPEAVLSGLVCAITAVSLDSGLVLYQNDASRRYWGDQVGRLGVAGQRAGQAAGQGAGQCPRPGPGSDMTPVASEGLLAINTAQGQLLQRPPPSTPPMGGAGAGLGGVHGRAPRRAGGGAAASAAARAQMTTAAAPPQVPSRDLGHVPSSLQPGVMVLDQAHEADYPLPEAAAPPGSSYGEGSCSVDEDAGDGAGAAVCGGNSRRRGLGMAGCGASGCQLSSEVPGSLSGRDMRPCGEGLLQQLFALDTLKYDRMIQDVYVLGRVWRGIIRVPFANSLTPAPTNVYTTTAEASAHANATDTIITTAAAAGSSAQSAKLDLMLASLKCGSVSPSGPVHLRPAVQPKSRQPSMPNIQGQTQTQRLPQSHRSVETSPSHVWFLSTGNPSSAICGRCLDSGNHSNILLTWEHAAEPRVSEGASGSATAAAAAAAAASTEASFKNAPCDVASLGGGIGACGGAGGLQVGINASLMTTDDDPLATSVWGILVSTAGSESLTFATAAGGRIVSGAAAAVASGAILAPYVRSSRAPLVPRSAVRIGEFPMVREAVRAAATSAATNAVAVELPDCRSLPRDPVLPVSVPSIGKMPVSPPFGNSAPAGSLADQGTEGQRNALSPEELPPMRQRAPSAPALDLSQQPPLPPPPQQQQGKLYREHTRPSPPTPSHHQHKRLLSGLSQDMNSTTIRSRRRGSKLRSGSKLWRDSTEYGTSNWHQQDRSQPTLGHPSASDLWPTVALACNTDDAANVVTRRSRSSSVLVQGLSLFTSLVGGSFGGLGRRRSPQTSPVATPQTRLDQHLHPNQQHLQQQRQDTNSKDGGPVQEDERYAWAAHGVRGDIGAAGTAADGVRSARSYTSRVVPSARSFILPQRPPSSSALPRVVTFASSLRNAPAPVAVQQLNVRQASCSMDATLTRGACLSTASTGLAAAVATGTGQGLAVGFLALGGAAAAAALEARSSYNAGARGGVLASRQSVRPLSSMVFSRGAGGVRAVRRCGSDTSFHQRQAPATELLERAGSSSGAGDGCSAPQETGSRADTTSWRHMKMELSEVEEDGTEAIGRLLARPEAVGPEEEPEKEDTEVEAAGEEVDAAEEPSLPQQQQQQRGGQEGDEAEPPLQCWHEVTVTRTVDPRTGHPVLLVVQNDVTVRVLAERHIALVSETEHRLLEQIFPRHVLAYMTEEGGPWAAQTGGDAQSGWRPIIRDISKLATSHQEVTLLFADIQGFTPMCKVLEPRVVMAFLNDLFTRFDKRLDDFGVYKVETIGDCYFVAGGLVHEDEDGMLAVRDGLGHEDRLHAERVFMFAKEMLAAASQVTLPTTGGPVRIRIGIHSGPVVSGVVGQRMPRFCLFGDTVNTTSRMESTGVPGCIHASEAAWRLLQSEAWVPSGGIEVKGRGLMQTFLWAPPDVDLPPEMQALLSQTGSSKGGARACEHDPAALCGQLGGQPPPAAGFALPVSRHDLGQRHLQHSLPEKPHHHRHHRQEQQQHLGHSPLSWSQSRPQSLLPQGLQPEPPLFPSQHAREQDARSRRQSRGLRAARETSSRLISSQLYSGIGGGESKASSSRSQADSNADAAASSARNTPPAPSTTDSGCELAALLLSAHGRLAPRCAGRAATWEASCVL